MLMLKMMMIIMIISSLIMMISIMMSNKTKMNLEKMSPFECGFNPYFFNRMPFSMNFFLISILFLIFDVEIAFIFPMIFTFKFSKLMMWILTSLIFIIILLLGLIYEWKQNMLNWI